MKPLQRSVPVIALVLLVALMTGCSNEENIAETSASGTLPPAVSAELTPEPSPLLTNAATAAPTPVKTTEPDIAPTDAPESEPAGTPSPSATTAPETEPSADSGKVELTDGFYYVKLDDGLKERITGMSYPAAGESSKIGYDDLRYVKILYCDFDGNEHAGELIVNKALADEVMEIFYELYKAQYPLASVRLVDDYGEPGDDNLSMAANNTSAFNYRRVTGSSTLSRHSYGAAIDINPMFNPYIDGDRIVPENGAQYADRSLDFAGKIDHDDLCYKLFTQHGWKWGGDWSGDKDYQHFSKSI